MHDRQEVGLLVLLGWSCRTEDRRIFLTGGGDDITGRGLGGNAGGTRFSALGGNGGGGVSFIISEGLLLLGNGESKGLGGDGVGGGRGTSGMMKSSSSLELFRLFPSLFPLPPSSLTSSSII